MSEWASVKTSFRNREDLLKACKEFSPVQQGNNIVLNVHDRHAKVSLVKENDAFVMTGSLSQHDLDGIHIKIKKAYAELSSLRAVAKYGGALESKNVRNGKIELMLSIP